MGSTTATARENLTANDARQTVFARVKLTPPLVLAISMWFILASDGKIDSKEISLIRSVLGNNDDLLQFSADYMRVVSLPDFLDRAVHGLSAKDKLCILCNAYDAMLADGVVEAMEEKTFTVLQAAFQIRDADFKTHRKTLKLKNDLQALGPYTDDDHSLMTPHLALAASLLFMMSADGSVDQHEIGRLESFIAPFKNLQKRAVAYVKQNRLESFKRAIQGVLNDDQKRCVVLNLYDLMTSDGVVAKAEDKLYLGILDSLGLSADDFMSWTAALDDKNLKPFSLYNLEIGQLLEISASTRESQVFSTQVGHAQGGGETMAQTLQTNVQSVSAHGASAQNLARVAASADPAENRQALASANAAPNRQNVATQALQNNRATVGVDASNTHREALAGDASTHNRQTLQADPTLSEHRQSLSEANAALNRQSLASVAEGTNRQGLPNAADAAHNRQTLPSGPDALNRQALPSGADTLNRQGLPDARDTLNRQGLLDSLGLSPLRHRVPKEIRISNLTEDIEALHDTLSRFERQNARWMATYRVETEPEEPPSPPEPASMSAPPPLALASVQTPFTASSPLLESESSAPPEQPPPVKSSAPLPPRPSEAFTPSAAKTPSQGTVGSLLANPAPEPPSTPKEPTAPQTSAAPQPSPPPPPTTAPPQKSSSAQAPDPLPESSDTAAAAQSAPTAEEPIPSATPEVASARNAPVTGKTAKRRTFLHAGQAFRTHFHDHWHWRSGVVALSLTVCVSNLGAEKFGTRAQAWGLLERPSATAEAEQGQAAR